MGTVARQLILHRRDDAPASPSLPRGKAASPSPGGPASPPRPLLADFLLSFSDRYRYWLFAGLVCVYLAAFNGQWRMNPDAGLFLAIGRNLARGHGYTYLGEHNHLAYPGWPLLIAATFKLFGTHSLVPVHVLMLATALATLALTYRLILLVADRPTAVVVTVGVAMTKTFFVYGFELWSDMPFTLGVMAFLTGYEGSFARSGKAGAHRPRWYDWALLVSGLATAIVMRPTMWPLLVAIATALTIDALRGRLKWRVMLGGAALVMVVAAACLALDPRRSAAQFGGNYEQDLLRHVTSHLGDMLHQAVTVNTRELFRWVLSDLLFQVRMGPFNVVLSVLVLGLGLSLFRYRLLWGLWFVLLLATLVLILPLDRYFLPVIPLLVFAWWKAMAGLDRQLPRPWGDVMLALLLAFGFGANGSKVGGIVIQQHRAPFLDHYDRGAFATAPAVAEYLHDHVEPNGLVLVEAPYARVLSFLSQRRVMNAPEVYPWELSRRPAYVIEPAWGDVRSLLQRAGMSEGPALFRAAPSATAEHDALPLSVHRVVPMGAEGAAVGPGVAVPGVAPRVGG